jgi:ABC-type cobalamin/Fe3+-siderophores transport system ATPase subunit
LEADEHPQGDGSAGDLDVTSSTSSRTFRLADRLAAARHARFVGRTEELDLFRSALLAKHPSFAVLYIHGPGGVGKTTLLGEYTRIAAENGLSVVQLDGRNIEPSPAGFHLAMRLAMDLPEDASPVEALAGEDCAAVLIVDTYEALSPLDGWLREIFLPQLPAQTLVVIAGRNPPAPAWRTDPGWADLIRTISLRNLRPEECRRYLRAQGVPEARHRAMVEFTHGHPLALSLVTDVLKHGEEPAMSFPEDEPHVVQVLLERFVQQIPGPVFRRALEICAHVRVTTETLLSEVLDTEDVHAVFEWLRGLSFVEQGPQGLFPHDLARDVLDADFRWRDPEGYRERHRQVRDGIVRRVQTAQGIDQQRAFFDLLYLDRHNPLMKPFHQWKSLGSAYAEPATAQDVPAILSMVRQHEGDASARIAQHWLHRQPLGFTVFRGPAQEIIGFTAGVALHQTSPEDLEIDPAIEAAWDFVRRHGPVRPGDEMIHHRFAMGRDTYQASSPAFDLVAMSQCTLWLTRPRLSWCFLAVSDAEYWRPTFAYLNLHRSPEADFAVGDRRYAVYTHDWRTEPASVWLDLMGERELASDLRVEVLETKRTASLVVLSQPEFEEAVRRALRDYTRPAALANNPLMRSRLVAELAEAAPGSADLQALIREAAESLRANPKDERLYRAIQRTYLEPAATQELAAELLALPFSTYRYHLTTGIQRMTRWLWQRELHGFQG